MNARIIELAKKSGLDIYGLGKDREKFERCLVEFAELIANGCGDRCCDVIAEETSKLTKERDELAAALTEMCEFAVISSSTVSPIAIKHMRWRHLKLLATQQE